MPGTMMPRQLGPRIRMPSNLLLLAEHEFLEFFAFGSDLPESGGDDHQAVGSGLAALPDNGGHGGGGRANHGQIGGMRQTGDVFVGLYALNRFPLGIHRINNTSKA